MESRARRFTLLCRALCAIVLGVWFLNWLGWAVSSPILTRIEPQWPQINPLTALLLALLSLAILTSTVAPGRLRLAGSVAAVLAACLSFAVLLEYLLGVGSNADLLLWGSAVDAAQVSYPGRPSTETAIACLILAIAILLLSTGVRTLGVVRGWLVIASTVLPAITLLGFLFSAVDLFIYSSDNRMAFAAATCLLGLAAATTFAMPDGPPMTWLASSSNRLTVFWLGLLVIALPVTFRAGDWLAAEIGAQSSADAVAVLVSMGVLSVGVLMVGVAQRRLEKRGERRLGVAQDRERAVLTALSDGLASLAMDGTIISRNPAAEDLLGPPEPGENLLTRLHIQVDEDGTEKPLATSAILERLQSGVEVRDDAALLSGTPRGDIPVAVLLFPITEGTQVAGIGATLRDVSERVEADRRTRRLARAVDASADAIYVTNPEGQIEYVNAAFTTITGWPAEEVLGQNTRILRSGANDPAVYAEMWRRLDAGEIWSGRLRNRRRMAAPSGGDPATDDDAGLYWAQSTIAPYFDEDDVLLGYVALQRDVSELVQRDLRQRASGLAGLLRAEVGLALANPEPLDRRIDAALRVLVRTLDPDGKAPCTAWLDLGKAEPPMPGLDGPTTFRESSGAPLELRDIEERLGVPLGGISSPRRFASSPESEDQSAPSGVALPLGGGHDNAVGHLVIAWREPHETPEILEGSFTAIADMFTMAIAEEGVRQATEAARRAAEEAGRAKSQFLANMSHEIRTPMNGVLGMLDMLSYSDLDLTQREHVAIAQASAESLLIVINDILDFSKIEAGKLDLEHIAFDVHETTEQVAALYSPQAEGKGLEISCSIPASVPQLVRGDPTRLRQILSNLIGNAVKFTNSGGISVGISSESLPDDRVNLRFTVRDSGIGMDAETQAALFDAFIQADASTTRKFGGTGLGLAITQELISLMGGTIEVASEMGVGTTFTVELPMPLVVPDGSTSPLTEIRGGRVLVVDDNDTNLSILSGYLQDWGMTAETAPNGQAALELAVAAAGRGEPFDVALVDLQMPGMDGRELGHLVKQDPRTRATRLVLVSSAGLSPSQVDGDFDAALMKPVRRSSLEVLLRETLATGRRDSESITEQGKPTPPLGFQGRVLLVEDNQVNQRVARGMLARLGLEVVVADDGQLALDELAVSHFDAILMDCQMPVMDGFEATRELRRREDDNQHTPVVATTADVMVSTVEACLAAGMDTYLSKPYTLKALADALRPWVNVASNGAPD